MKLTLGQLAYERHLRTWGVAVDIFGKPVGLGILWFPVIMS